MESTGNKYSDFKSTQDYTKKASHVKYTLTLEEMKEQILKVKLLLAQERLNKVEKNQKNSDFACLFPKITIFKSFPQENSGF